MTEMLHILIQVQLSILKSDESLEESDEKEGDGTGEGGLSIDLCEGGRVRRIPLPKHLGHVTGCL